MIISASISFKISAQEFHRDFNASAFVQMF